MDTKLRSQELNLDNIQIIPFLRALEENDPDLIQPGLKRSKFKSLAKEFLDADRVFESPIERRAHKRKAQMKLIASCLFYLKYEPLNEEIWGILRENKIEVSKETYFEDLKGAYKKLERLDFLRRQDESKTKSAFEKKKKPKAYEKNSIFDMMTALSTGLELSLDFNNMVVSEFISYKKALNRKRKMLESTTKKSSNNGKRRK